MKAELITNLNKIRVKVFTHNDLDGVSCSIVLKKLYDESKISFDFSFIGYDSLEEISNFFNDYETSKLYDFIFITDINIKKDYYEKFIKPSFDNFIINKNNYQNKEKLNLFKKLFIIDHHKDSEECFKDIQNDNIEFYNDKEYCACYSLFYWSIEKRSEIWKEYTSNFYRKDYDIQIQWLKEYVELVNDWDLFLWKEKHNLISRDLNILFTHIRREKFIMMQIQKISIHFSYNSTEKTIIRETLETINKELYKCINNFVIVPLHNPIINEYNKNIRCLVIKNDENISLICDMIKDIILDNRNNFIERLSFDADIIVNVSFKYGSVNFRRVNEYIDLKEIANWYGGGGHSFAAGCPLNSEDKNLMEDFIYPLIYTVYKPHCNSSKEELKNVSEETYKKIYKGHIPK